MRTIFRWSCYACGARWRVARDESRDKSEGLNLVKSVKITTTGAGCPECRDTAREMERVAQEDESV